jgi:DNA polymerase-1
MILPEQVQVIDIESTGLNPYRGDAPFALSLCNMEGETKYWEWPVDPLTREVAMPDKAELEEFRDIIENPEIEKGGHHIKYDLSMIEVCWGIKPAGIIHDSMYAIHALKSDEYSFQLKPLAKKFFKLPDDDEKLLGKAVAACRRYARTQGWKIHKDVAPDYWLPAACAHVPELVAKFPNLATLNRDYCGLDTQRSALLLRMAFGVMETDEQARTTYEREIRNWYVTYIMEKRGVRTNLDICREEIKFCESRKRTLRSKLEKTFGPFEIEVPDDLLRNYLFTKKMVHNRQGLGLVPNPRFLTDKKRIPQVTKEALDELKDDVPIVMDKVEYDRHHKAQTTYHQNYLDMAVLENGYYVIHAGYNQVGPVTGRFSCRNPNLMNVPKRAREGDIMKRVRRPFGPRPGMIWLHLDWKAIEARITAEEAGDRDLLNIFAANGDPYEELVTRVEEIAEVDLRALFADQDGPVPGSGARQVCKNNFLGWTYGEGIEKLAKALRLGDFELARKIVNAMRLAYPRIMPFMQRMQRIAERDKFIVNRYNRRVPIPRPFWKHGERLEFWYKAVNYLIQSTAADMMKEAMWRCHNFLEKECGDNAYIVMTIHDELVFEVKRAWLTHSLIKALAGIMKDSAEEHYNRVEFPVDVCLTRERWDTPDKIKLAA